MFLADYAAEVFWNEFESWLVGDCCDQKPTSMKFCVLKILKLWPHDLNLTGTYSLEAN